MSLGLHERRRLPIRLSATHGTSVFHGKCWPAVHGISALPSLMLGCLERRKRVSSVVAILGDLLVILSNEFFTLFLLPFLFHLVGDDLSCGSARDFLQLHRLEPAL